MTRVDRHDNMLKRMFRKYIIYDMLNTIHAHKYHITHTHTPCYTHITVIPNHLDAKDFNTQQLKIKLKISHPLLLATTTVCLSNFLNFKFKFSASMHFFPPS